MSFFEDMFEGLRRHGHGDHHGNDHHDHDRRYGWRDRDHLDDDDHHHEPPNRYAGAPPGPRVACPQCGAVVAASPGARFCDRCGGALASEMKCRACGSVLGPVAAFCQSCGAKV